MTGTFTTHIAGINLRLPPPNSKMFLGKVRFDAVLKANLVVERTAMRPESLYEVLRVPKNATPIEIKTAYRSLAKIYHPDACDSKQHGDQDFIEIHKAYTTLSDPELRATYDMKWSIGLRRKSGLNMAAVRRPESCTSRRWETDQCW